MRHSFSFNEFYGRAYRSQGGYFEKNPTGISPPRIRLKERAACIGSSEANAIVMAQTSMSHAPNTNESYHM